MDIFKHRWYLVLGIAIILMSVGVFLGTEEGVTRFIPGISMTALLLLSPVLIGLSVLYLIHEKEKTLFIIGLILGAVGLLLPLGVLAYITASI